MSFSNIRPLIRTEMDNLGFHEWTNAIDPDNIPSTLIDKSYHIEIGSISPSSRGQTDFVFSFPVTLRVFFKDFNEVSNAIDEALSALDDIYDAVLIPSFRVANTTTIFDFFPTSANAVEYSQDNDNIVVLEAAFSATVFKCY